jgi:hypothetical protein
MSDSTDFVRALAKAFNIPELRQLSFDLKIDSEELPCSDTKTELARELFLAAQRRASLGDLSMRCAELRPHVDWSRLLANYQEDQESLSQVARQKEENQAQVQVSMGNVSGSQINVAGGNLAITKGDAVSGVGKRSRLQLAFSTIYDEIDRGNYGSGVDREEVQSLVARLEAEIGRGERASPVKVERWLDYLAELAPGVHSQIIARLMKHNRDVSIAIQAVVQKISSEDDQPTSHSF